MHTELCNPEMHESLDDFGGGETPDKDTDNVIHALMNPLCAIITNSDAILGITDLTPEELHEYLHQIRSNAYRLDAIINRRRST